MVVGHGPFASSAAGDRGALGDDVHQRLYQRLAKDEEACYLVEESLHGARTFHCNARMADLFLSTEELQGLVDQTGLAVGHLMMR